MKLLVGRLLLGCILAVLVLADDPVVESAVKLEESVKIIPEVIAVAPDAPVETLGATKIFVAPDPSDNDRPVQDVIVIPDYKPPHNNHNNNHHNNNNNNNDNHHNNNNNDNHHNNNNDNDNHHNNNNNNNKPHRPNYDNDYHHHRPPSHHHQMPPPGYQYPPYYPPYYPPPPPPYYGPPIYAPVPPQPYPYYPPQPYYPPHMKPITVIHGIPSDSTSGGSSSSSSSSGFIKPTDLLSQSTGFLWNLIDQKNNELWNLLSNKLSRGGSGSNKGDTGIQEIVVIKPGIFTGSGASSGSNKGKNFVADDCNKQNSV